jgi:hypothetical protein
VKTPKWNLESPKENVVVLNGKIQISDPTTFVNGVLRCGFTIDSSTEFIPPSNST